MQINVSIVEDESGVREQYAALINLAQGFRCVSEHPNGEHALKHLPAARPEVALVDIKMPKLSGIELVRRLKHTCPKILCLMLTVYGDDELIFDASKAGAVGYLLKRTSGTETLEAIRSACDGGSPMTPEIARRVVLHFREANEINSEFPSLTPRELEVLRLVAKGWTDKEVAGDLGVSHRTIANQMRSVCEKLHVSTRSAATAKYLRSGL